MKRVSNDYKVYPYLGSQIIVPAGARVWNEKEVLVLNDVGYLIWDLLKSDISEDAICREIVQTYEVDQDTARRDVRDFLKMLSQKSLLVP